MKEIIATILLLFFGMMTLRCFGQDATNPYQASPSSSADYYASQSYQAQPTNQAAGQSSDVSTAAVNNLQAAIGTLESVQNEASPNNEPSPYVGTLSAVHSLSDVIFAICRIAGLLFMLAAVFYFDKYRKKQGDVTMGQVFWTLIVGIAIFLLPVIAQYADISKTINQVTTSQPRNSIYPS